MTAKIATFTFVVCILCSSSIFAEVTCIETTGEAIITGNNVSSAKAEAISRAKWSAMEQISGMAIKAERIVQNMKIVDESVSNMTEGYVSEYKVLREAREDDALRVRLNVCVDTEKTLISFPPDKSIIMIIKTKNPASHDDICDSDGKGGRNDTSILTEAIIEGLLNQGYTVSDLTFSEDIAFVNAKDIQGSNERNTMKNLMRNLAANMLFVGQVGCRVSSNKGVYSGYGINMPFHIVDVWFSGQIYTKDSEDEIVLFTVVSEQAKGAGNSLGSAAGNGLKILSEKIVPAILCEINRCKENVEKLIGIRVDGVSDMNTHFEVKEILQNIAWVSKVEEKGMNEFIVNYSEKPAYLANSIAQKKRLRILNFTDQLIEVIYLK